MKATQNPFCILYIVYTYRENVFCVQYISYLHIAVFILSRSSEGRLLYINYMFLYICSYMNVTDFRNVHFEV